MKNAIEIKNLSKSYKDFTLNNINLTLPSGTILGLIGANGAGKSTLIQAMLKRIHSNFESIHMLGYDMESDEKKIKENIAVIYDNTHYNLEFTPKFIASILSGVYRNWNQKTFEGYVKRFQLPYTKKLKQFSKGMKMKLEFAIALSHGAKLLILDEATSGLDPIFRNEILDIIREFTENEDHSVILSSHITSDLDKIADYIAFLHEGNLQFVKTYDEMRNNYGVINCKKDFFESLNEEDIISYHKETYGYKVMVQNRQEIQKIYPDIEIANISIEDVMLFYTKGEKRC